MRITRKLSDMIEVSRRMRRGGRRIGFVPTMGFLHQGHLSLVDQAAARADAVIVSIYVNPTQFGEGEDLDSYPRDLERDCDLCRKAGVDTVFCPSTTEMYAEDCSTVVEECKVSQGLCGASRPGHFRGVTTVVMKLLNIVQPDTAVFGQKDLQQLRVLQRMVRDLNLQVELESGPIVREADGLAMSSRNTYLSGEERARALGLSRGLKCAQDMYSSGVSSAAELRQAVSRVIGDGRPDELEYVEVRDGTSLESVTTATAGTAVLVAARYGGTRLIDNTLLGVAEDSILGMPRSGR